MLWVQDWKSPASELDAEKLLKLQLGAVSPMWLAFASVATVGAAMWSASHWMRLASGAARAVAQPQPAIDTVPATVTAAQAAAPVAPAFDAPATPVVAPALAVAAPQLKAPKAKAPRTDKAKGAKVAPPTATKIDGRTKAARQAKAASLNETPASKAAKPASGKRRAKARTSR